MPVIVDEVDVVRVTVEDVEVVRVCVVDEVVIDEDVEVVRVTWEVSGLHLASLDRVRD